MEKAMVVKSNNLIQARYDLNLNEQKILLYAVTKLDRDRPEFNYVKLEIKELMDLLDSKGKRYEEIRETVRNLRKKEIIINTKDKEYIAGWLSSAELSKGTGKMKLQFDSGLVPYLLQLKERFTRYELQNILYLQYKYSIRIYELLKQYERIGKRQFTLKELKDVLVLDGYDRVYDLERRVLKPAKDEINEKTDIQIDYSKIKEGRRVTGVLFTIEPKDKDNKVYIEYLEKYYNISDIKKRMGMTEEQIGTKQVMELYQIAVEKTQGIMDPFEYVRLNYLDVKSKPSVRNKYGYLKAALEGDYAAAAGQLTLLDVESI